MREILFRGKRMDNGEWVEGFYINHVNCVHYIVTTRHGGYEDTAGEFYVPEWYEVDPSTVGQYTGLTDKNGKRIFEGDIVQFKTRVDAFKPMYVRWYENEARFVVSKWDGVRSYPMDMCWEYEVLGNIHDNPELLEGDAE